MTGTRCTVAVCNNSLVKTKARSELTSPAESTNKPRNVMYHAFPSNPEIRKIWIHRTRRPGKWNADSAHICSEHFTEDDYERDLKAELLNYIPRRRRLKKTAVPTRNLGIDYGPRESGRADRLERRGRKEFIREILKSHDEARGSPPTSGVKPEIQDFGADLTHSNIVKLTFETDKLKEELRKTKVTVCKLRSQLIDGWRQGEKLTSIINTLKLNIRELKKKKMPQKMLYDKVRDMLRSDFSENQIKILLHKKKRVNWHHDEIAQAHVLRNISKRAYIFLREKLNYPLPSISALQRRIKVLQSDPESAGILQGLLMDTSPLLVNTGLTQKLSLEASPLPINTGILKGLPLDTSSLPVNTGILKGLLLKTIPTQVNSVLPQGLPSNTAANSVNTSQGLPPDTAANSVNTSQGLPSDTAANPVNTSQGLPSDTAANTVNTSQGLPSDTAANPVTSQGLP